MDIKKEVLEGVKRTKNLDEPDRFTEFQVEEAIRRTIKLKDLEIEEIIKDHKDTIDAIQKKIGRDISEL